MSTLGIMGGTFDPVHVGHLDCARNAQWALGLERIVFMPAATTNFKQGRRIASAADRLAMCKIAVECESTWSTSNLEIARGGTTYTVDTLREMRLLLPDTQLFFITGSDALMTLDRWRGAEEMAALASFVSVERPGYGLPQERRDALAQSGFTVYCVVNEGYDISSSEIRRRVAAGEPLDGMVPEGVEEYICMHHLYTKDATEDALGKKGDLA